MNRGTNGRFKAAPCLAELLEADELAKRKAAHAETSRRFREHQAQEIASVAVSVAAMKRNSLKTPRL